MKNGLVFFVAEVNMAHPYISAYTNELGFRKFTAGRVFPCPDSGMLRTFDQSTVFIPAVDKCYIAAILLRLLVNQGKNPFCAGEGHGHGVDLLRNLPDIAGELLYHTEIRCNHRNGERTDKSAVCKQ